MKSKRRQQWKTIVRLVRYLIPNLYFNFHYLPLRQAIHLPILLYRPHLRACRGRVVIDAPRVRFGMVRLGFPHVGLFPPNGIIWEQLGGIILFKGRCRVGGGGSAICVGTHGRVEFGDDFVGSADFKLICYKSVTFSGRNRFGWSCMVMDTDFHRLTVEGGGHTRGFGPVTLGTDTWCGNGVLVLKKTQLPDRCIVAARSVVSGKVDVPPCSVVGGNPATLRSRGVWRNVDDDKIDYEG